MPYRKVNGFELKKQFRGDEDILNDLIDLFIEYSENLIEDISKAIEAENGKSLKLHAHTLKGILKNLTAESASKISYELELHGLRKNFKEAYELYLSLIDEIKIIRDDLRQLKSDLEAA